MKTKSKYFTFSIIALAVIAVAGCAGVPTENKKLEEAKAAW